MNRILVLGLLLGACGGGSTDDNYTCMLLDLSTGVTDTAGASMAYTFAGGSATFAAGQAGASVRITPATAYPGRSAFAVTGMASASGTLVVSARHT